MNPTNLLPSETPKMISLSVDWPILMSMARVISMVSGVGFLKRPGGIKATLKRTAFAVWPVVKINQHLKQLHAGGAKREKRETI